MQQLGQEFADDIAHLGMHQRLACTAYSRVSLHCIDRIKMKNIIRVS